MRKAVKDIPRQAQVELAGICDHAVLEVDEMGEAIR